MPTAPPYQHARLFEIRLACAAAFLGAPIKVTAHMWLTNAVIASKPSRMMPSHGPPCGTSRRSVLSPAAQHLHAAGTAHARLTLRSRRYTCQLGLFLVDPSSSQMFSASRRRVVGALRRAAMGRSPPAAFHRTNISGDAPTSCSSPS